MDSAKVNVGDVATATQYNLLRKDTMHSGYYNIESVDSDDADAIFSSTVGDAGVAGFYVDMTSVCYFDVQIPPQIDTGVDWSIKIAFDMSTTDAGKAVRLQLDYCAIADAGDTTPSAVTLNETVSTPNTLETLKVVTLSTIKIPNSALASGKSVTFKFSRLGADALDTHSGDMRLFSIQLIQTQT